MKVSDNQQPRHVNHVSKIMAASILSAGIFYLSSLITSPGLSILAYSETKQVRGPDEFDWESLPPSRKLEYRPCYGEFRCARLELPMDWAENEEHLWDHTVAIALLKLPANVSVSDPRYGGEIYTNPGGPGSSGVNFAHEAGRHLASLVSAGPNDTKLYDIVGFDPRGVMHSSPIPDCFHDLKSRQLWYHMAEGYKLPSNSNQTLRRLLVRAEAYREMCDPGDETSDGELLKQHMSSTYVARDLLAIIDQSAELEAKATHPAAESHRKASLVDKGTGMPKGMLQYWGFSYGTALGGYFASLYPDRVERMILDANCNFDHWVSGNRSSFISQTDGALKALYSTCYAAGPDKCAMYEESGPENMENTISKSLQHLRDSSIPIWRDGMLIPEILTYEKVVEVVFSALYAPYQEFPPLARGLAALKDRTNNSALEYFLSRRDFTCRDDTCFVRGCLERAELQIDAGLAYLNSDNTLNGSVNDFFEMAQMLRTQSQIFGEMFPVDVASGWNAWPVEPRWRFTGPMGGRTKHPILFISNTGDPVGPIENAIENAKIFNGAVALTQDSLAHSSLSAPSLCTARYRLDYFQTGTLPTHGTVCKPDWLPFDDPPTIYESRDEEIQLRHVLQDLVELELGFGRAGRRLF